MIPVANRVDTCSFVFTPEKVMILSEKHGLESFELRHPSYILMKNNIIIIIAIIDLSVSLKVHH